ncbi:DNA-directed RNA polymerase subunit [Rhizoctonia solani AG-3 Rhs1AP]|uniref:DNA-directed RNA polymerase subunit n=2 Tax=Rhizoctonia solani AG-3 TaxID=1086053 RepID=A0A074RJT5_9AGAM|nr:DNA-directed RNA polymerase subunit [Rhizoctonia solani AG-3 Rhs1AP]KEP47079.1 DNA-directed RNA polymerase subunit [Rhizoctonia solani 123E]
MLFCPTCANILIISSEASGYNKWACQTCPYEFPITKQMTSRTRLQRKEVDDVLGGDAMWKDVDQTDVACPKCDNGRAYFMQLQIRSADEPMTTCEFPHFVKLKKIYTFIQSTSSSCISHNASLTHPT